MRRTYWTTQNADGSTTVESQGPVGRAWRAGRIVWALIFILTAIIAATQGAWSTSGIALIIGALILPNFAKHRKAASEGGMPPNRPS